MRFRTKKGLGHPVIAGQEIQPKQDGCYHVEHPDHIAHMLASGFEEAPPAAEKSDSKDK